MEKNTSFVKLPIIPTFIQVLLIMKQRFKYFFKFSIPLLIYFLLMFLFRDIILPAPPGRLGFIYFLAMIGMLIVMSIVVVAYHRTFIMDIKDVETTKVFRLTSREWRFIGWYFAISFFIGIVVAVFMFMFIGLIKEGNLNTTRIIMFSLYVPISYVASRWLLVLPAASVDDDQASLSFAWALSENNGWRVMLLIFILPIMLELIQYLFLSFDFLPLTIISILLGIVTIILGIGVISLSYSYLRINTTLPSE